MQEHKRAETPQGLIRFLATWADKVLSDDWREALGGPCGDALVTDYLRLRRRTRGWNPNRLGPNNHKAINPAAVAVLVAGPGKDERTITCGTCRGRFTPRRSTARYCSPRCRQSASRSRRVPEPPICHASNHVAAGQEGCRSVARGSMNQRSNYPSKGRFTVTPERVQ